MYKKLLQPGYATINNCMSPIKITVFEVRHLASVSSFSASTKNHCEEVRQSVIWLQGQCGFSFAGYGAEGAPLLLLHQVFIPTKYLLKTRGSIFTSGHNLAQVLGHFGTSKKLQPLTPCTQHNTESHLCFTSTLCQKEHIPKDGFTQGFLAKWDFHPLCFFCFFWELS